MGAKEKVQQKSTVFTLIAQKSDVMVISEEGSAIANSR